MFENKEILLVEDNPYSLELTQRALKTNQLLHLVRVLPDGAEALDYVLCRGRYAGRDVKSPPVLVLLDLKLPLVSGLEVLRELRAESNTRLIPVVIFSASQSEADILKSYELGANGYVVKPVNYDRFTQVIGDLGRYWLSLNVPPSS